MTFNEIANQAGVMYGIVLILFLLAYIAFKDSDRGKQKAAPSSI